MSADVPPGAFVINNAISGRTNPKIPHYTKKIANKVACFNNLYRIAAMFFILFYHLSTCDFHKVIL